MNVINLGVFVDGERFEVLRAADIVGQFDTVALPADSAILHWTYDYEDQPDSAAFVVSLEVEKFEAVARNRLEYEVGRYLNH